MLLGGILSGSQDDYVLYLKQRQEMLKNKRNKPTKVSKKVPKDIPKVSEKITKNKPKILQSQLP